VFPDVFPACFLITFGPDRRISKDRVSSVKRSGLVEAFAHIIVC
jgi:hypothetical protein